MKYAVPFAFALCCVSSSADAQLGSADSVVHRMFSALKAKDEKAFLALQPSREQKLKALKNELRAHHELAKQFQKKATHPSKTDYDSLFTSAIKALSGPEAFADMDSLAAGGFQHVIKKGEEKGLDWAGATLTGFWYDTSMALGKGQVELPEAIKRKNGTLDFSVSDSAYELLFFNVSYFPSEGGWFAGLFTYGDEIEIVDVVVESVQEDEPPPPPPLQKPMKAKTKGKPPATKRKT